MKPISDCISQESAVLICREEEGKKICFSHADFEVVSDVVSIDKCVFKKVRGERSCDFLFLFLKNNQKYKVLKNKKSKAYYVELKGIDLEDACEQILNSIEKTRSQISEYEINAIVVSSREFVPKFDNNEFYREVKRLIKRDIQFEITPFTEYL